MIWLCVISQPSLFHKVFCGGQYTSVFPSRLHLQRVDTESQLIIPLLRKLFSCCKIVRGIEFFVEIGIRISHSFSQTPFYHRYRGYHNKLFVCVVEQLNFIYLFGQPYQHSMKNCSLLQSSILELCGKVSQKEFFQLTLLVSLLLFRPNSL